MKTIEVSNPKIEAHKAAMAVAFSLGQSITVDNSGDQWFLLDYDNNAIAVFVPLKQ